MRSTMARFVPIACLATLLGAAALGAQQAAPAPITQQDLLDGLKEDGSSWLLRGRQAWV